MSDMSSNLGSTMATFAIVYSTATMVFFYTMARERFPPYLLDARHSLRFRTISVRNPASANRLKADALKDSRSLVLTMDYNEEISDVSDGGIKVWWTSNRNAPRSMQFSVYPAVDEKYYKLKFHNCQETHYCSYIPKGWRMGKRLGKRKEEIVNDLNTFKEGRDDYERIGKPWKREQKEEDKGRRRLDPISKELKKETEETTESKVTLSGVLNSIDGLWSSCGGERIIVFTTNYPEKLDQALIRRGRMDKHIEMSYCALKHSRVAENLTPKFKDENVETRLNRLIEALKATKEEEGASRPNEKRKRGSNNPITTGRKETYIIIS
ncbi:hypothetical protein F3Y22_tig00110388pilonHSYRG00131 [Hibiscus syriacus]|uniref:ATPase AAA-type core domain-containing protein n=1 Tax=Hibiscus syriacus TaxID=106335 RepID=A0A6A3AV22_HIBSY|nr:hypothetical protein F3Y22_tig00110388pilonHSYRG00131 [Hibiscus syriacus]